jgi:hypothetical protein
MIQYYSCVRLLLFPQLLDETVANPRHIGALIDACVGICRAFKQIHHQSTTVYYSPLFVMSLLLAGKSVFPMLDE